MGDASLVPSGDLVPAVPPDVPGPVDPIAERMVKMRESAVQAVEDAVTVDAVKGVNEDQHRAHRVRLAAAKLILGAQRSALPLPRWGELEAKDGTRRLRLRWGSSLVRVPSQHPQQPDDPEDR